MYVDAMKLNGKKVRCSGNMLPPYPAGSFDSKALGVWHIHGKAINILE
ncbi:hypothetical protein PflQ2_3256 [Pseudomonas fluorescens Q2-87]|uniref:Uncharacterized protein n=1 Tax=Pseudomonas fluorescens (strain Q2-87) TaxID=1038922 RepID=J2Y4B5_PSEFQ|nr:hypothetical protein PflQ2_3256 [Pseudomonas fluorescens Q2-87]